MQNQSAGKRKRFSVSLPPGDYERLQELAKAHRPQLSLQYVVEYAIQQMLSNADDGQLADDFAAPLKKANRD